MSNTRSPIIQEGYTSKPLAVRLCQHKAKEVKENP